MKIVHWHHFLPKELLLHAQDVAWANKDAFIVAGIRPPRPNFRSSLLLLPSHYLDLHSKFIAHLMPHMAQLVQEFGFDIQECKIDLQMTRHGNGDYFRRHVDAGNDSTNQRKISFVCYFRLTDEQMFHGGELRLFKSWGRIGRFRLYNPMPKIVRPMHNSVVFFKSNTTHEVTNVQCAERWEDGRFTLGGWVS